jgi:hypothetical protein
MAVTTNITVSFGTASEASQGHLSAEIDSRPEGKNNGQTSFAPGQTAYFLIYKSSNVTYDTPQSSLSGNSGITRYSTLTVSKTEDLTFAATNSATLNVPASGGLTVEWMGKAYGNLTLGSDKQTVTINVSDPTTVCGVARVTYNASADCWGLTAPQTLNGSTEFSILVLIVGRLAGESA